MGRARDRDRRQARERGIGDHAAAGSALHPGAAEPDLEGAAREPRDLHGCRSRSRLAAAVAAPGRQRGRAAGAARIPERRGLRRAAREAVERRPLARRRASVRQSAHSDRPAQHREGRRGARGPARDARRARTPRPTSSAIEDFAQRWQAAVERWTAAVAPLKGKKVVTHHKGWAYLENWAGLVEVGNLEPKPGLPPSAAHLAELLGSAQGPAGRV